MTAFFPSMPLALQGIPHTVETGAALLFTLAFTWFVVGLIRHPFWGPRLRTMSRKPIAMVALLLSLGFVVIAVLDGISWKDRIGDDPNIPLEAREPRSVFDRLFSAVVGQPEYEYREKSYAAPMARFEFVDKDEALKRRHLLGTTQTGYDTLYTVLKGCKPAVVIGTLPLLVAIPLALVFGITAGFFGGRIDDLVVYLYTTLASIPGLLLLIALITALGQGLIQIAVGLGVSGWIGLCRLVRGETFKLREMEYVQAAICLGVPRWKIILRHIVPNLMHIVIITAILAFSGLVLSESVLAYLGIGLEHSWGGMIDNARDELSRKPLIWWNMVAASCALFLLVLAVNVLGDAIRDVLDPRTSSEGES